MSLFLLFLFPYPFLLDFLHKNLFRIDFLYLPKDKFIQIFIKNNLKKTYKGSFSLINFHC